MPFNNNYWDRKFSWQEESDKAQKILAERMDEDFNDICNNGLANLLTQTAQHGLPTANMNFDGHKITNLKAAEAGTDAVTLGAVRKINYFEDEFVSSDNFISIRILNDFTDFAQLDGMHLFFRCLNPINTHGDQLNVVIWHSGSAIAYCPVFSYTNPSVPIIVNRSIVEGTILELIGDYRSDVSMLVFFLKDFPNAQDYTDAGLSTVADISGGSAIKDYIVATAFAADTSSPLITYTATKTKSKMLQISCHMQKRPMDSLSVDWVSFNFSNSLEAAMTGAIFRFKAQGTYSIIHRVGQNYADTIVPAIQNPTPTSLRYKYDINNNNPHTSEINLLLTGESED